MRMILIDPYLQRIDELDLADELAIYRNLIGCKYLDAVPFYIRGEKLALWIDDEGDFNDGRQWYRCISSLEPVHCFYGRAVLVGWAPGGKHRDVRINLLDLADEIRWQ